LDTNKTGNWRKRTADGIYTFFTESVDKGVLKYGDNKMDIYGKEGVNTGKHFTAIYKFENEQLTICYNLAGDSYPTAFGTKNKPTLFLSVFKKDGIFKILENGVCYMPSFNHFALDEKEALYSFLQSLDGKGEPLRPTMGEMCPMKMRKK